MAAVGEEAEYESDPEDAPLAMRRREASDDEDYEGSDGGVKPARKDPRAGIGYDGDSDGQGGAPEYEDEEIDDLEEEELEEEVAKEELEEEAAVIEERAGKEGGDGGSLGETESTADLPASERDGRRSGEETVGYQGKNPTEEVEEEKKKEKEPYAVPTAGAFYMHDDRFQENDKGRHMRMPGGRKLWESKDDRAWVHDRFEEMNVQDTRYVEGRRMSKGRFRGRGSGKPQGNDRDYGRGNRPRAYYDHNSNQSHAPKFVRGRGPRRYEPAPKNKSEVPETQHKQSAKPQELTSKNTVGRQSSQASHTPLDRVLPRKHVFASSLSSASPPFYPSGSSDQDISVTQKKHAQAESRNKALSSSMQTNNNFLASQSGSLLRGKVIVDSVGHGSLYMDTSLPPVAGKTLVNPELQSGSSLSSPSKTPSYSGTSGRGLSVAGLSNYQQTSSPNQVARASSQIHPPVDQQRPAQTVIQPVLRTSSRQLGQRPGSGNQATSSPQSPSTNSSEVGGTVSPSGSSTSKTSLVAKGNTSNQGSGKGSDLYSGAQVTGAAGPVGVPNGDHSFPTTATLLQVMQYAGQNHGSLGVPAVGMALPGYVAQPQLGFGNSEMTWVPVLAGASGALGASYCSPYIALDSSYYARSSGQTSSSVTSSREPSTTIPATTWKPPQRPEMVNDEFGQRQNKPRRYSEMNFGQ